MWIGNGYNTYAGDVDINVTLNDNNFHDNTDGGAWIQDEDAADGSSVTVSGSGNSWINNGIYGMRIYSAGDGDITVNLTDETITGNGTGISVEDTAGESTGSSYNIAIHESTISGNTTMGVDNTSTFTVDAEINWWGDATGADHSSNPHGTGQGGDLASDNVTFIPWYATGTTSPGTENVTVTHESSVIALSDTIQGGIDAALDGDTIDVAAGTYDEALNIDGRSGLTVNGADQTTVILEPTSVLNWDGCGHTSGRKVLVRVANSTDVTLQNMTMDFEAVTGGYIGSVLAGMLFCDSTGTVHNNIIRDLWQDDASGGYYEIGSDFTAPGYTDTSRAAITISDNIFKDMGRLGVVTHWYVDATITGNTFYNTVDDFGYGVEIGGPSTATISGNTFYGFDTPALSDSSESAGIYIENAFTPSLTGITKNVVLANNEIYDSQYGMWIGNGYNGYAGDVDINVTLNNNNFHNNTEGGAWIQDEDKEAGSSVTVSGSGNYWMNNALYGMRIYSEGDGNITVNLTGEMITGNDIGIGVEDTAGGPNSSSYAISINDSTISDNTTMGIENTSTFMVDAEFNWWGIMSGPYDGAGDNEVLPCTGDPTTEINANGEGNDVSDNVDYCPWYLYPEADTDEDGICNPYASAPECTGSDQTVLW